MIASKTIKSIARAFFSGILFLWLSSGQSPAMSPFSYRRAIISQQLSYSKSNENFKGSADLNLIIDLFNFGGNLNYSRPEPWFGSQNNDYLYVGIGLMHLLQLQYLSTGALAIRSDFAILSRDFPFLPFKHRNDLWEYLTGMVMLDYNFPARDIRITIGIGAGI